MEKTLILIITCIVIGYAVAYLVYKPKIIALKKQQFDDHVKLSNYIHKQNEKILTLKDKLKDK